MNLESPECQARLHHNSRKCLNENTMEPPFSILQVKAQPYLTFCVSDPKSVILLLNFCHLKFFLDNQIKENEMGEHTRFWFENLDEDPGIEGRGYY
jgi:hypothetical protein